MTLIQLKYVLAVDTYRHFAKAAESCFVTQPTLSMQINKLEKELDVLIFDRSKHPVEPTEIGKQIIEQARKALQEAERIEEIVKGSKGLVSGEFRMGIIPTVSTTLLPRFLRTVADKYPDIQLKIEELQTDLQPVEIVKKDLSTTKKSYHNSIKTCKQAKADLDLHKAAQEVKKALKDCPDSAKASKLSRKIDSEQEQARSFINKTDTAVKAAEFDQANELIRKIEKI
jgi:hypothetical protein